MTLRIDRPGRAFDGAPLRSGRRGATAHHGVGADRSPRAHEAALFARRVAAALRLAQQRAEFDQLVLVAGPPFLGLLRAALPAALRARVVAEIHKDLVHAPQRVVREHLASMANAPIS